MNRTLQSAEIEYVLQHLSHHLSGFEALRPYLCFHKPHDKRPSVFMPLSARTFKADNVLCAHDDLPVLFPLSDDASIWTMEQDGNLIFHHDMLKSAFYLLSSYGEWKNRERKDKHGRFDFNFSIQKQLNIIEKPIVNYYFNSIVKGLLTFAERHHIAAATRQPFENGKLLLTHDIDRIDYYTWRGTASRWLRWMGLRSRQGAGSMHFKMALDSQVKMFVPRRLRSDPFWSFDFLRNTEKNHHFNSTWFFLNHDGGAGSAPYRFKERRIQEQVSKLQQQGCEVGLHASFLAAQTAENMTRAINYYTKWFKKRPRGVRAHFLRGLYPRYFYNLKQAGLEYDAGFGFAVHPGFRNSYCWPFQPFDHDRQKMIDTWVIPMAWMDTTLFEHQNMSYESALQSAERLWDEVARFNGIFNLLWHTCRANEWIQPGIHQFYGSLCNALSRKGAETVTGLEVLRRLRDCPT